MIKVLPLLFLLACDSESTKTNENNAPEFLSLEIIGDSFSTSDSLLCEAQYSDVDGDVVSIQYEWTNQTGDIISSDNSVDLQLGLVAPNEYINCMATISDGEFEVSEIISATIQNTPPSIDSISISPDENITPESILICSATASDNDGGSPNLTFSWTRNEQSLASTDTLSLPVIGNAVMGDELVCTVTALDEHGGETSMTESVVIGNSPPSITEIAIVVASNSALSFTSQLDVLCLVDGVTDPNNDIVSVNYQWFINGVEDPNTVGETLSAPFSVDDEITCSATPNDGYDDGLPQTTTITIPNSLPEIFTVEIEPNLDVEADAGLTCYVDAYDVDDGILLGQYEWLDGNGNSAGTGNTIQLNPNSNRPFDEITCISRVTDNNAAQTEYQTSITIINTEPVVDQSAIITSSPSPVSNGTLTCSASFSDLNDGALTPAYTWALANGTILSSSGDTYIIDTNETDPTDNIICSVTAVDLDGATISTNTAVTIVNTSPTIDTFTISPSLNVEANTLLEILYTASDLDVEPLSVTTSWYDGSTLLGTGTTLQLDNTRPVGSVITATITVTDSYGASATNSENITILNTDPVIDSNASISASPAAITTGVLTCSSSFSDYNDGPLTPTYTWTLANGTLLPATGNTLTVDPNNTNPNDEIICTATATDLDGSSIASSDSITIANTAPVIDAFTISPSTSVEASETLEMIFSTSDLDEDIITNNFSWNLANGVPLGNSVSLVLDSSYTVGSVINGSLTITDPYGGTDTTSMSATVLNTVPEISVDAVIITNTGAVTNGSLQCFATFSDFNDGALTTTYTWLNGSGNTIGLGDTYNIDSADVSPMGTVLCLASATDSNGASITSTDSIQIVNTAPSIDSITISPDPSTVDSTITCQYTASDIDSNESQNASITWSRNGTPEGGTSSTYAGTKNVFDTIGCSVTITDNYGGSDTQNTSITISNRDPVVDSINLPSSVNSQTDITAIVLASDVDGQSVTLSYDWYRIDNSSGGSIISVGSNSSILPASQFDKYDQLYVVVTPFDGTNYGSSVTSSSVSVYNTAPTTPGITVTPASTNTYIGNDLTCTVTTPSSDLDNDPISYYYEWLNPSGGVESDTLTSSTSDIYLSSNVDTVGTWTCRVTPTDGDDSGSTVTASTTAIGLESCKDYKDAGETVNGVYTLYIGNSSLNAYCDMNTEGGGWTLYAITTSTQCAQNLPWGPNELLSPSNSAYITTLFQNSNHTQFLQDFRATGSSTTFTILWNFNGTKSVSQRLNDAVSSGESVSWSVVYSGSIYSYNGTWRYSNAAGISSKWNSSGTNFSNDDGIWGAQNGTLDGDSPGPYLSNGGWGHQNNNAGDGNCQTYYYSGTNSTSGSIRNLMYFR